MNDAGAFTDWRIAIGSHLPQRPADPDLRRRRVRHRASRRCRCTGSGGAGGRPCCWALRVFAVATCLMVALQPVLELGQVTRVPNHVAVLVDSSRSMIVKPPDGKERYLRAADAVEAAGAARSISGARRATGSICSRSARSLGPTDVAVAARRRPRARPPASARPWPSCAAATPAAIWAAVVIVSDGIDTGRVGRGPVDGETRKTLQALGAPVHTVLVGEKELRDLSVAAVLADDFAFVRTPLKLEAVIRATGLARRQVEVTLSRDGRLVDVRSVLPGRRRQRAEGQLRLDPRPPGQLRVRDRHPGAGGRGAVHQQQAGVHAEGDPRPGAGAARVRPPQLGPALPALDAAPGSQRRPGVVLHPAHRDRRPALERPGGDVADPLPRPGDLRRAAAQSFDLLIFQNFNYAPPATRSSPTCPGCATTCSRAGRWPWWAATCRSPAAATPRPR